MQEGNRRGEAGIAPAAGGLQRSAGPARSAWSMQTLRLFLLTWLIGGVRVLAAAPLDATVAAHGGLERWQRMAYLSYNCEWTAGERVLTDARKWDLLGDRVVITAEKYTLGRDAQGLWVSPDSLALGDVAARLYLQLPTRLITMPVGLATAPGAEQTDLGRVKVGERELRAVQVKLPPRAGAGGAGELFVVYFEAKSGEVKLVRFSLAGFTPALDTSALTAPPTDYVAVFDIWQTVTGLTVPRRAKIHAWRDGAVVGEPLAIVDLMSPALGRTPPEGPVFERPGDADALR